jgi:hypothetical protein
MQAPEKYAEEFCKAVAAELRSSLDDMGSRVVVDSDGKETEFQWRDGCVTHVREDEETDTRKTVRLGVRVFVKSVQFEEM